MSQSGVVTDSVIVIITLTFVITLLVIGYNKENPQPEPSPPSRYFVSFLCEDKGELNYSLDLGWTVVALHDDADVLSAAFIEEVKTVLKEDEFACEGKVLPIGMEWIGN